MKGMSTMSSTPSSTPDGPKVVYSVTTGEAPKGAISLTKEATEPLPPPTRVARKTVTKKHKPRVSAKAEPLHTEIKVDPRVWKEAKLIMFANPSYTKIEIVDHETVRVR